MPSAKTSSSIESSSLRKKKKKKSVAGGGVRTHEASALRFLCISLFTRVINSRARSLSNSIFFLSYFVHLVCVEFHFFFEKKKKKITEREACGAN